MNTPLVYPDDLIWSHDKSLSDITEKSEPKGKGVGKKDQRQDREIPLAQWLSLSVGNHHSKYPFLRQVNQLKDA